MNYLGVVNRIYFGNTIKAWLISLAIGLVIYIALALIQRIAITRLAKLAEKTDTDFDDALVEIVRNTKSFFFAAMSVYAAIRGLYIHPRAIGPLEKFLELLFLLQIGM